MKVLFKLAVRNLLAAGVRTWLNVIVLSLTFVVIIAAQGLFRGMGDQAARASIDYEFGGGQFWHPAYDPYDPLTIQDAHGPIPPELEPLLASAQATPILIIQGTLYPQGRFLPVLIRGIDPAQNILKLPSHFLAASDQSLSSQPGTKATPIPDEIPAMIGTRMATAARLSVGDTVILRWRDARGAFDARTIRIVHIFRTIVQSVDAGQVWLPLPALQSLAGMPGEATVITLAPGATPPLSPRALAQRIPIFASAIFDPRLTNPDSGPDSRSTPESGAVSQRSDENKTSEKPDSSIKNKSSSAPTGPNPGWVYRDQRFLLRDIDQLVAAKTAGSATIYIILLFMSLLAIFDTQVLNIFHRLKEIGTLVALGLTRRQVVLLLTLEGTLHAVLAAILAALYGYPLLSAFARTGWKMPEAFDSFGIALGERLVPVFTGGIIIGTVILIMSLTALVSFMPARRLSRLRPTDALRGKLR